MSSGLIERSFRAIPAVADDWTSVAGVGETGKGVNDGSSAVWVAGMVAVAAGLVGDGSVVFVGDGSVSTTTVLEGTVVTWGSVSSTEKPQADKVTRKINKIRNVRPVPYFIKA
jgi:hypothetical protein